MITEQYFFTVPLISVWQEVYFGKGLAHETIFMISDSGVGMGGEGGGRGATAPQYYRWRGTAPPPKKNMNSILKVRPSTKQLHVIAV